jgi:dihydroflavonol-4-reductase
MKVFLTGGTGFIGQALAKSLIKRGWSVTALVRKPGSTQAQVLSRTGAQLTTGDINDRESMRSAMSGADIVVHNAGQYEYGLDKAGEQRMRAINVAGTKTVLGLAHELKVPRTVYVSTVQAFGDTGDSQRDENFVRQAPCRTIYEQAKTDAHKVALGFQQQGMPLIIVCPHQVIGPNDHSAFGYFMRLYVNGVMPPVGWSPNTIFCCVVLNDLAEGIALAAEKGRLGEMYLLCGERTVFREIFDFWRRKPGSFAPRIWLPAGLAAALFAPLEPLQRMAGLPAFISRETVRAAATNWNFSNEKAKRELGWTPCSAETVWFAALDGERELLSKRKGQSLIQRLKPLDSI